MRKAFTASIYLRNRGQVLLVHHKRFGLWVPVGGELEANETPFQAARRELEEETGLKSPFVYFPKLEHEIPGLLTYEEHDAGAKGWHMNFAFVADTTQRKFVLCDEHEAYAWMTPDDGRLRTQAPPNVWRLVERALLAGA